MGLETGFNVFVIAGSIFCAGIILWYILNEIKMIKPLKIIYKNTIRTSNGTIENEGTNSPSIIIFRNQGTSIAYVLGNVKIFPGESWQLKTIPES